MPKVKCRHLEIKEETPTLVNRFEISSLEYLTFKYKRFMLSESLDMVSCMLSKSASNNCVVYLSRFALFYFCPLY